MKHESPYGNSTGRSSDKLRHTMYQSDARTSVMTQHPQSPPAEVSPTSSIATTAFGVTSATQYSSVSTSTINTTSTARFYSCRNGPLRSSSSSSFLPAQHEAPSDREKSDAAEMSVTQQKQNQNACHHSLVKTASSSSTSSSSSASSSFSGVSVARSDAPLAADLSMIPAPSSRVAPSQKIRKTRRTRLAFLSKSASVPVPSSNKHGQSRQTDKQRRDKLKQTARHRNRHKNRHRHGHSYSRKRQHSTPKPSITSMPLEKIVYASPRIDNDDEKLFPPAQQHQVLKESSETRWNSISQQAGDHKQDGSELSIARGMAPLALKAGITSAVASRVRRLTLNLDPQEDVLPEWMDVISSMFFHLEHITINSDHNPTVSARMRRLYVLYRFPDLVSIDGTDVTDDERRLARPNDPNGERVERQEWVASDSLLDSCSCDDGDANNEENCIGDRDAHDSNEDSANDESNGSNQVAEHDDDAAVTEESSKPLDHGESDDDAYFDHYDDDADIDDEEDDIIIFPPATTALSLSASADDSIPDLSSDSGTSSDGPSFEMMDDGANGRPRKAASSQEVRSASSNRAKRESSTQKLSPAESASCPLYVEKKIHGDALEVDITGSIQTLRLETPRGVPLLDLEDGTTSSEDQPAKTAGSAQRASLDSPHPLRHADTLEIVSVSSDCPEYTPLCGISFGRLGCTAGSLGCSTGRLTCRPRIKKKGQKASDKTNKRKQSISSKSVKPPTKSKPPTPVYQPGLVRGTRKADTHVPSEIRRQGQSQSQHQSLPVPHRTAVAPITAMNRRQIAPWTPQHPNDDQPSPSISNNKKLSPSKSLTSPFPMQFRDRVASSLGRPDTDEDVNSDSATQLKGRDMTTTVVVANPPKAFVKSDAAGRENNRTPSVDGAMETISTPIPLTRIASSPSRIPLSARTSKRGELPPPCPGSRRTTLAAMTAAMSPLRSRKAKRMFRQRKNARSTSVMDLDDDDDDDDDSGDGDNELSGRGDEGELQPHHAEAYRIAGVASDVK